MPPMKQDFIPLETLLKQPARPLYWRSLDQILESAPKPAADDVDLGQIRNSTMARADASLN